MNLVCQREDLCHSIPADQTGNLDDLICIATNQSVQWKTELIMTGQFTPQQLQHTPVPCLIMSLLLNYAETTRELSCSPCYCSVLSASFNFGDALFE